MRVLVHIHEKMTKKQKKNIFENKAEFSKTKQNKKIIRKNIFYN